MSAYSGGDHAFVEECRKKDCSIDKLKDHLKTCKISTANNYGGWNGLHTACIFSRMEVVKFLVEECKADVDSTTNDDATPLFLICNGDHPNMEFAKYLIEKGADIECPIDSGRTALHAAARYDADIVRLLLSKGAKVDALDLESMTPLHVASGAGRTLVCELLLAAKADIMAVSCRKGRTALHFACKKKRIKTAKFLIAQGASTSKKDAKGKTPLDFLDPQEKKALQAVLFGDSGTFVVSPRRQISKTSTTAQLR
eukprot:TRINITY_DN16702_c0_g1_i1.p1 TRINITY_DN16702_c0_g1~~TRINITY_DN16702_c0_g1_i1.p1  ORF type:complete len:281 (+),score=53.56 TRINITY_DN16702_c0_g1_i1:79-843(+)